MYRVQIFYSAEIGFFFLEYSRVKKSFRTNTYVNIRRIYNSMAWVVFFLSRSPCTPTILYYIHQPRRTRWNTRARRIIIIIKSRPKLQQSFIIRQRNQTFGFIFTFLKLFILLFQLRKNKNRHGHYAFRRIFSRDSIL